MSFSLRLPADRWTDRELFWVGSEKLGENIGGRLHVWLVFVPLNLRRNEKREYVDGVIVAMRLLPDLGGVSEIRKAILICGRDRKRDWGVCDRVVVRCWVFWFLGVCEESKGRS